MTPFIRAFFLQPSFLKAVFTARGKTARESALSLKEGLPEEGRLALLIEGGAVRCGVSYFATPRAAAAKGGGWLGLDADGALKPRTMPLADHGLNHACPADFARHPRIEVELPCPAGLPVVFCKAGAHRILRTQNR